MVWQREGTWIQEGRLEIKEAFTPATELLHNDIFNEDLQGMVNMLMDKMSATNKHDAKEQPFYFEVQRMQVGDKCSSQFF